MRAGLAKLPATDRVAVVLVDREGFSPEAAARILGLPPADILGRLDAARDTLAPFLPKPDPEAVHMAADPESAPPEPSKPRRPRGAKRKPDQPPAPPESPASAPDPTPEPAHMAAATDSALPEPSKPRRPRGAKRKPDQQAAPRH